MKDEKNITAAESCEHSSHGEAAEHKRWSVARKGASDTYASRSPNSDRYKML